MEKAIPGTADRWLIAGTPSWSEADCDHTAAAGQGFGGNSSQALGSTYWFRGEFAKELDIGKDVVHRIWRTAGLRPHRFGVIHGQQGSRFERKAADIIGLYLNPLKHAESSVR